MHVHTHMLKVEQEVLIKKHMYATMHELQLLLILTISFLWCIYGSSINKLIVVTEQNKIEIVKLGALRPLIRLTRARDIRVKRNSAGALLNLSHVGRCRIQSFDHVMLKCVICLAANRVSIVGEGGVPYLVQLLDSQDEDIQFYCSATLSNVAVDGEWG